MYRRNVKETLVNWCIPILVIKIQEEDIITMVTGN